MRKIIETIILCPMAIPFALIVIAGCETKNVEIKNTDTTINGQHIQTYTIDSCEYIGNIYGGNGDFLTHKGNCKYCESRSAKKIENNK